MSLFVYVKNVSILTLFAVVINNLGVLPAHAHARWVLPSHTVISGDKPMAVSLDYSISNDIFHPDIPLGGKMLNESEHKDGDNAGTMSAIMAQTKASVISPKGEIRALNGVNLGRKTSTYFTAEEAGTYRVEIEQPPIDITLYKTQEGESQRLFGDYNSVKDQLPVGANSVESIQFVNRIQTFITHNAITTRNLTPTGKGLELKHTTHPNELFAQEKSTYHLLFSGKAVAADSEVTAIKITKAGTRFRNQRQSLQPQLSKNGKFEVTWPEAGFYLIEIEHEVAKESVKLINALFLTVEVHPE